MLVSGQYHVYYSVLQSNCGSEAGQMWHKFSALHHFSRRSSTVFSRSLVFNLITVYTPVLLLAGSIVTSAKQILSPIHCEGEGKDGLSKDYVETYCYIEGTFNLYMKQVEQQVRPGGHLSSRNQVRFEQQVGKNVIYPNLGQFVEGQSSRREISYYQWVTFFLLIEALVIYLPRQIWHQLTHSQCLPFDFTNLRRREDWEDKKNFLVWHMKQTRGNHEYWLWQYLLTELLAIALLASFFILTDVFLGGDFYNYGLDWVNFMHNATNTTISPMTARFPRLTVCKLQYHSRGGTINSYYPLCLLPINCFNDKIFLFLYFWYCMLFGLSLLRGLYMLVLVTCKPARRLRLKFSAKLVPEDTLDRFINAHNLSDWFVLCNLAPTMDPVLIAELVTQLVYEVQGGESSDSKPSRLGKQEKSLQSVNYI
ncbi:innexin inx2 isoform X4 [Cherax quadricarinatus]|uniref:innexin inx2 isoform X4 n=1 Tax=Cherax quadricarinatus TaxID=27406 RepID=UPI002379EA26|nr:innexin inx2-like isoform X1 [Cherax quadricarinatus]